MVSKGQRPFFFLWEHLYKCYFYVILSETLTEIKASSERKEKKVSLNVSQLFEMSATLVKREIEGPSNAENNPSSTADNNPSSEVDNDLLSKPENPLSLKVENDPSLKAENDSGLSEMQSKQKKRKIIKF